jgi:two-component system, NtrC family, response regulator GlrR
MSPKHLLGCSAVHQQLLDKLAKVARTDVEVLISGPTGVGKELCAHYVHDNSRRHAAAFVPVNCGMLADGLLENEMFGHIGGAFTGARPKSDGLVQAAEGGTLFMDEVDSLSIPCQIKLLRFLQEKEYRRLGETHLRKADVRIIAATNIDLHQAVLEGKFRQDLYFRLRVVPIEVLPLCQRSDDLMLLLEYFVEQYAVVYGLPKICFSDATVGKLRHYAWPGNVRELENCVCYLTCLELGRSVEPEDLPLLDRNADTSALPVSPASTAHQSFTKAKRDLVSSFERRYLTDVLSRSHGNISEAARLSGKARRVFFELMRKHNIDASNYRSEAADGARPGPMQSDIATACYSSSEF